MSKIVKIIGSFVVTIVMYCVPFLLACSIFLNWYGLIKLCLVIAALVQITLIACAVYEKAEEGEW